MRDAPRATSANKAPSQTRIVDVVIVGGGIAGLAAARTLHAKGISVAVVELENGAGGNSRGHQMQVNGQTLACPRGAHYLPVPDERAPLVQSLLIDLGLAHFASGKFTLTQSGQRHLCHSPQERVYADGHWQDGLLPLANASAQTLAQVTQFAQLVNALSRQYRFDLPVLQKTLQRPNLKENRHLVAGSIGLDAITFDMLLSQRAITDPLLRAYLDYCCRDDYGAGLTQISAWAGVHYFASRHGFSAPGMAAFEQNNESAGVLTWPQGNGWLVEQLAKPLTAQIHTGWLVKRVAEVARGVEVDAIGVDPNNAGQLCRWQAKRAIVSTSLRVAARVVESASAGLTQLAQSTRYSAWVVANAALSARLAEQADTPDADKHSAIPAAWDNVVFGSGSLGYVDATHQNLSASPSPGGPTVLTWYRALGSDRAAAQQLLDAPWTHWRDLMLAELSAPHPDMAHKLVQLDVMRHGHAMSVPTPGTASSVQAGPLAALGQNGITPKIAYAHSDLAGYSVFEEAYTAGVLVAQRIG